MPETRSSLPDAPLGPYDAAGFRLATGASAGAGLIPAARFLFASETIAVPVAGPFAGCEKGTDAFADIAAWAAHPTPLAHPPLVWIAAAERKAGVRIAADGRSCEHAGKITPLALVPKIALNRSWADASTFAYLSERTVTMRGETGLAGEFTARTLWPEDWRLDSTAKAVALTESRTPRLCIRGLLRSAPRGGADSPPETHPVWERHPGRRDWAGRPVLAFVLNGAQGDDDEAWGGHFALATGQLPADGRLSDLLVANFYTLDSESEKGILPAPVPLDNYLADLNGGQAWYRPSYVMLAILADDRAPALVQGALNRLYLQFWRHQLEYRHATMNCASISVDTLRALGWNLPNRGPSDTPLAWLSIPAKIFTEGAIAAARNAYEYLSEDRTRLMPAAAFEETVFSLMQFVRHGADPVEGALAKMLAEDVEALVGVRLPQIPSSRRWGTWPAANPREYMNALPRDPAELQVVPVPPRPFPAALRDPDLLPPPARRSTLPLIVWTLTGVLPLAWIAGAIRRLFRSAAK
ncbi:MAG: hypothetical protein IPP91_05795 [Betaproteobacteria bacterium]|nr:hypothetical protein [Betaproteobacteria bacterium]